LQFRCGRRFSAFAQIGSSPSASHVETKAELYARLTTAQQQRFQEAGRDAGAKQYAEALAVLKSLLVELPGDPTLSKFAAEAALHIGDDHFARDSLQPVARANPDDWQAASILTRAYAELGDKGDRDAGIAHMLDLHKRGLTPPTKQDYILEVVQIPGGNVAIYTSLEPFGPYKIHNVGEIFGQNGQKVLMATIESSDGDQALFAREHPKEAAAGLRMFSLDGYKDTGVNSSGQKTQTHYTFKFFVGQPDFDTVRQSFLDLASGKIKLISSRDNLPVP
jgi:hypothetical protein